MVDVAMIIRDEQLTGVHNVTSVKLSDGLLYPGMTR